jgi:hypothetical protein
MHLVDRPTLLPGHCIVNLSSEDPGGFIDTLNTVPVIDPRVYVSRQAVIDMGRMFGFPDPAEVDELRRANKELASMVEDLKAQLAEADRYAEAAEYTLTATFGDKTKIRHKPGRRPKE